ncbi:MAG: polysaccharide pyruvyl transferase family protein [Blautia wexlerae]|uniref:polysaccharide pyruvyl transferase family protein n=1 Tax=Blautia wexlerae TaxID=418240 RepID=UPI0034A264C9
MKICILSMQRINNMGSLLQAYALKRLLETLENQVEFIDIKKIDSDYQLLGDYKQKFKGESEQTGVLGKMKKIDKYTLNRLKIRRLSDEQSSIFEKFRINALNIDKVSNKYDLCVIGSDEVFNCLNAGAWGFTSQLFGNVVEANNVITYAASCGSTKYDELPLEVATCIRETFKRISAFSARDMNTHEFISRLTGKKISDNLDPVLIYDFSNEVNKVKKLPKLPEHYCIIYSYYNRIHKPEEIDTIKRFCDKHNLTPIAIGSPQFWLKNYVTCSPFQCLKIFQNADFVITDTFHGTIFAAKYAPKYAVLIRDSNRNKLLDLIKKIKIEKHLIENMEEIEEKFSCTKDIVNFQKIIEMERIKTITYLEQEIGRQKL